MHSSGLLLPFALVIVAMIQHMANVEMLGLIAHKGNQSQFVTANIEYVQRTHLVCGREKRPQS